MIQHVHKHLPKRSSAVEQGVQGAWSKTPPKRIGWDLRDDQWQTILDKNVA